MKFGSHETLEMNGVLRSVTRIRCCFIQRRITNAHQDLLVALLI